MSRVFDANKCKEFFDEEYAEEIKRTQEQPKKTGKIFFKQSRIFWNDKFPPTVLKIIQTQKSNTVHMLIFVH